jgi:hypothetical protein
MDKETANKIIDLSAFYRGKIIDLFIPIETIIERIIASHLAESKYKKAEIFSILGIQEGISIRTKVNIITTMIKEQYPEFLSEHKDYLKQLDEAIKIRNIAAHRKMKSEVNHIKNFDGETITWTWLKTSKGKIRHENLEINNRFIQEKNDEFSQVYNTSKELYLLIEG